MKKRSIEHLFKTSFMTNVPPYGAQVYESNDDPISKWISIGMDVSDKFPEHVDKSHQDGFFVDDGVNIAIPHFVWMLRQVNVNHPAALGWLTNAGYEVPPTHMAWIHEVVFDYGKNLITASSHRFEEAWMPVLAGQRIIIMESAVINVERVVQVTSLWSNVQAYAEAMEQKNV